MLKPRRRNPNPLLFDNRVMWLSFLLLLCWRRTEHSIIGYCYRNGIRDWLIPASLIMPDCSLRWIQKILANKQNNVYDGMDTRAVGSSFVFRTRLRRLQHTDPQFTSRNRKFLQRNKNKTRKSHKAHDESRVNENITFFATSGRNTGCNRQMK